MQWEDAFTEDKSPKNELDRLAELSDSLMEDISRYISKRIDKSDYQSVNPEVSPGVLASAIVRILLGLSLHGFHAHGIHREVETERQLTSNPKILGEVIEHIVSVLGMTLNSIDSKNAYSINVIRKEKS